MDLLKAKELHRLELYKLDPRPAQLDGTAFLGDGHQQGNGIGSFLIVEARTAPKGRSGSLRFAFTRGRCYNNLRNRCAGSLSGLAQSFLSRYILEPAARLVLEELWEAPSSGT